MGSLILVVMRVMDHVRLDTTRPPTECSVTLGAPHLVAPVNLENTSRTRWAVAGVARQELRRRHVVRVTRVSSVLLGTLDLVTRRTRPVFT